LSKWAKINREWLYLQYSYEGRLEPNS
jgi:hypothetical protein